jgi:hypothetical protein
MSFTLVLVRLLLILAVCCCAGCATAIAVEQTESWGIYREKLPTPTGILMNSDGDLAVGFKQPDRNFNLAGEGSSIFAEGRDDPGDWLARDQWHPDFAGVVHASTAGFVVIPAEDLQADLIALERALVKRGTISEQSRRAKFIMLPSPVRLKGGVLDGDHVYPLREELPNGFDPTGAQAWVKRSGSLYSNRNHLLEWPTVVGNTKKLTLIVDLNIRHHRLRRSLAGHMRRASLFAVTVPVDLVTSPIQLVGLAILAGVEFPWGS